MELHATVLLSDSLAVDNWVTVTLDIKDGLAVGRSSRLSGVPSSNCSVRGVMSEQSIRDKSQKSMQMR
jgi:hypothetical protein